MNRVKVYNDITSSIIDFEIQSVIRKKISINTFACFILLLHVVIVIAYFFNKTFFDELLGIINIYVVVAIDVIIVAGGMLPILLLNYDRGMRLIFTQKGIALYPNKFICGVPLSTLVAERWEEIECYSILELPLLMKLGSDPKRKSFLYIRTKGIIPRCVNNYGISVFAVTGHHLNEEDIVVIHQIFDQHKIKNETNN